MDLARNINSSKNNVVLAITFCLVAFGFNCEKKGKGPLVFPTNIIKPSVPFITKITGNVNNKNGVPKQSYIQITEKNNGKTQFVETNNKGEFQANIDSESISVNYYSDSTKANLLGVVDAQVKSNTNISGSMTQGDFLAKINNRTFIRQININHIVTYCDQLNSGLGKTIGNAACSDCALTMMMDYFYLNGNASTISTYPFTKDVPAYDGPISNYSNTVGPASVTCLNRLLSMFEVNGVSDNSAITDTDAILSLLENQPLLFSVYAVYKSDGSLLSDSGHFMVLSGWKNNGTPTKSDDTLLVNDPYSAWESNFNGQNREIPFCDLFIQREDCTNVAHAGVYYKFRRAFNFNFTDKPEERQYSTVVTSGNYSDSVKNKISFSDVTKWNVYRGSCSYRFYALEDNQTAIITPWLTVEGEYEIQINHYQDPTSNPNKKASYSVKNINGNVITNKEFLNYNETSVLKKESLGTVCLKNGDFVEALIQKNQNLAEGTKFKFAKARTCDKIPPSIDFSFTGSNPMSGTSGASIVIKPELTFSDIVKESTILSGAKLYVSGVEKNFTFTTPVGKKITIIPNSAFPYNANIELRLNTTLASTSGKSLGQNSTISFITEKQIGNLSVIKTTPSDLATSVSINPTIEIEFSENADSTTATNSNIFLKKDGMLTNLGINISTVGKNISIKPINPLENNTKYLVSFQGIKGTSGSSLTGTSNFSFTTETGTVCNPVSTNGYINPNPTYIKGIAIATNSLNYSGSILTKVTINKALPSGLTLNTTNGSITGTPLVASSLTDYIVSVTNCFGSKNVTISIKIEEPVIGPSALNYQQNFWTLYVGQSVSNTATVSGTKPMSFFVNTTLPGNLLLNASDGSVTGSVGYATSGSYTVTVSNSAGSTSKTISISVLMCQAFTTQEDFNCSIANGSCFYQRTCSSVNVWGSWEFKASCYSGYTYNPSTKTCLKDLPPLEITGSRVVFGSMITTPYSSNTFNVTMSISASNDLYLIFSKPDGSRFSISGEYNIYDNTTGDRIETGTYGTVYSFPVTIPRAWLKIGTNRIKIRLNADAPNNSIHLLNTDIIVKRNN
jgi:hypothetical protein